MQEVVSFLQWLVGLGMVGGLVAVVVVSIAELVGE